MTDFWDALDNNDDFGSFVLTNLSAIADQAATMRDEAITQDEVVAATCTKMSVFEMALRLIAHGQADAVSVATTALRASRKPGETMADVLRVA